MRHPSRLPAAVLLCTAMLTAALTAIPSCTDAVGIAQCRMIETARCESAVHCGFSKDETLRCIEFYHDQCLHGIENADEPPADTDAKLCVDAIRAVASCAQKGAASMQDCPQARLVPAASPTVTPCAVILKDAHLLEACAFVSSKDAGAPPPPDSGSSDSGSSDSGSSDSGSSDSGSSDSGSD